MILKGSQRAGAAPLAAHLLNTKDNEHVRVHDLRGFAADDLHGALTEAQAISKGTKCRQFLFSLSMNPPIGAEVSEKEFERAADQAERTLGLVGQPRAIVFHEKEGRRHAHVVWSRIDAKTMTAINLPHFKRKLTALSREIYLENEWSLPKGLQAGGGKSPLNFTLAEWQQAKRSGVDPREIKAVFREAWEQSDSLKALGAALAERGYFIAQGDRRGLVAIDTEGKIYSVTKYAGIKAREARAKLGEAALPSLDAVKSEIAALVTDRLKSFASDVKAKQMRELERLTHSVEAMRASHAEERKRLATKQSERWALETDERAGRFRAGLRGLLDNFTGRARAIRTINESETIKALRRDRLQRDRLAFEQLRERQPVQERLQKLRERHAQERAALAREIVRHMRSRAVRSEAPISRTPARQRDDLSLER